MEEAVSLAKQDITLADQAKLLKPPPKAQEPRFRPPSKASGQQAKKPRKETPLVAPQETREQRKGYGHQQKPSSSGQSKGQGQKGRDKKKGGHSHKQGRGGRGSKGGTQP